MWRKSRRIQHKHPGDSGGGERGSLGRHLSLVHREEKDTIYKAVRLKVTWGAGGTRPRLHAETTGPTSGQGKSLVRLKLWPHFFASGLSGLAGTA